LDRIHKGSLYARAGLPDYWIVNLPERRLQVYRDPEPGATAVSQLARPDRRLQQISDLFL
jgi:Uma2 family endonuclease